MKTMKISVVNRDPDFMASEIIYPYRTGSSICNLGFSPPSGKWRGVSSLKSPSGRKIWTWWVKVLHTHPQLHKSRYYPKMLNNQKCSMVNVNCSSFLLTSLFWVDIPEYSEWPEKPASPVAFWCWMVSCSQISNLSMNGFPAQQRWPASHHHCLPAELSKLGEPKPYTNPTVLKKERSFLGSWKTWKFTREFMCHKVYSN